MTKEFARTLRKNLTDAEQKLWRRLRRRQLHRHKFRRQFPMGAFVLDFVCLERKLIVELDGGQHASESKYDAARTLWLKEQGYSVLRFWNNQVFQEMEAVLEKIGVALSFHPPPPPSPTRGEGI
ncbi:MAG: DUF559 domain-containing protein [SAR324 cluster bacterium]|nr:DUF559 domain-containing protein [SAR324 cluster bacterium]